MVYARSGEEEGEGEYEKRMAKTLADWGIADGSAVDVDDDVSELKLKVITFCFRPVYFTGSECFH